MPYGARGEAEDLVHSGGGGLVAGEIDRRGHGGSKKGGAFWANRLSDFNDLYYSRGREDNKK